MVDSSHLGLHKNALQLVYKEYDEERLRKEFGDLVRVKCFACFLNSNSRNHYCYCICDTSINILGWWIPKNLTRNLICTMWNSNVVVLNTLVIFPVRFFTVF